MQEIGTKTPAWGPERTQAAEREEGYESETSSGVCEEDVGEELGGTDIFEIAKEI